MYHVKPKSSELFLQCIVGNPPLYMLNIGQKSQPYSTIIEASRAVDMADKLTGSEHEIVEIVTSIGNLGDLNDN